MVSKATKTQQKGHHMKTVLTLATVLLASLAFACPPGYYLGYTDQYPEDFTCTEYSQYEYAVEFVQPEAGVLTQVSAMLSWKPGCGGGEFEQWDGYQIRIYDDSSNGPGSLLYTQDVIKGNPLEGSTDWFDIDLDESVVVSPTFYVSFLVDDITAAGYEIFPDMDSIGLDISNSVGPQRHSWWKPNPAGPHGPAEWRLYDDLLGELMIGCLWDDAPEAEFVPRSWGQIKSFQHRVVYQNIYQ